ncbi:class A beta-lactamase [Tsukamurella sp. 8F]|uniref:class A beta-lactamase n=1 Tax=unclassified Tsukamurella TaxID=2633480 RepID=UPI0023BA1DE3|nr:MULTISPECIES: class A beta-lactamase [unclassified Tsukamurella]MDF0530214.1 class A beta-lactamase [Tsukamurella sp. 8J]MDF0586531.1 class A beta-lactamase [Tsukamurella sp. 8F]
MRITDRQALRLAAAASVAALTATGCHVEQHAAPPAASSSSVARLALADSVHRSAAPYHAQAGVVAVDLSSGETETADADERFSILSTFKTYAVAAILARTVTQPHLLDETESVAADDIVTNSPVLQGRVGDLVSVRELCQAALQRSDNTAGNLLLRRLGGPAAITALARRLGDTATRLDRWEPDLNESAPGDPRDTTTARGLATGYRAILDGDFLPQAQRDTLVQWMRGTQTSQTRFRAQLPRGWSTADKTGGGYYQTTNDAGILFGPAGQRILLVVLTRGQQKDGPYLGDLVASIAAVVARR